MRDMPERHPVGMGDMQEEHHVGMGRHAGKTPPGYGGEGIPVHTDLYPRRPYYPGIYSLACLPGCTSLIPAVLVNGAALLGAVCRPTRLSLEESYG